MREVLSRTKRPSPVVFWLNVGLQSILLGAWGWRVVQGERGIAVLLTIAFAVSVTLLLTVLLADLRSALVLTDDALLVERPLGLRPRVFARAGIRAVDVEAAGRRGRYELLVLSAAGRTVRLGGFDVPARALLPRLRDWAGAAGTPDGVAPRT